MDADQRRAGPEMSYEDSKLFCTRQIEYTRSDIAKDEEFLARAIIEGRERWELDHIRSCIAWRYSCLDHAELQLAQLEKLHKTQASNQ